MKKDKDKKKKRIKQELPAVPEAAESPAKTQPEQEPAAELSEDPLQHALTVVGGKWKLRILWALRSGDCLRYGEIKQQISGITDMMLSQSLRELTADGMALRRQYQQIPPKVEYQLTPAGAELLPAIELFRTWAASKIQLPPVEADGRA